MLSVGTISAGSGYQYLTEEVATGAEDYYVRGVTEIGERPGRWIASSTPLLGLDGVVRAEHMARMYGQGLHPDATPDNPVALGPPFPRYKTVPERLADARAENPDVDAEQWERIEHKIRKAGERNAVAGFDLTFSAPKSWSVLWAAAPDEAAREAIWAAHHEGVDAALAFLEREACFSRTGHAGIRQVDADGFVAAAFDHRQSRNGDPQMHTHVAVLNRVRCTKDGQWRSLDGREVYAAAAAAGGMYDLIRESALERSLGVVHEFRRPGDEVREIEGITDEMIATFSSRRRAVEARLAPMLADYESKYGREASPHIRARMSEWATLETRPAKGHGETMGGALDRWEAQARGFGTVGLAEQWDAALHQRYSVGGQKMSLSDLVLAADRRLGPASRDRWGRPGPIGAEVTRGLGDAGVSRRDAARLGAAAVERADRDGTLTSARPEQLADKALQAVAAKKATWTRNDLARQVEKLVRRDPPTSPERLQDRVDQLVALALRPGGGALALNAPPLVDVPPQLRRERDGASEHDRHNRVRYAATAALLAEGRLVATARTGGAPTVSSGTVESQIAQRGLGQDQAAAARRVLQSGRRLDVIVGPAGTGKTHTTAAIAAAWTADGRPVLGLALSQNAAHVLADASGNRAENIAKWLLEDERGAPGWQVNPGQLVIVDEAGMVPTAQLDQVVGRVVAGGGKVLLVGDPEQLAAPGAGGAMRLLVTDVGAAHLDEIRRFTSLWEGDASLRLRDGDPDALLEYNRRARIVGGTPEQMQEKAYTAWLADTLSGRSSLLMADTTEQAAELASRARADLVGFGRVGPAGLVLANGNRAGVGDRIVTRRNDRRLAEPDGLVANRDQWIVEAVGADGSLTVRRHDAHRPAPHMLPAWYVAQHVELAYASTVHAAQGCTVDTSHAVMSAPTGADGLYVGMTRGREGNWAYVACDTHPTQDEPAVSRDPVATLAGIIAHREPSLAATQVLRDEHERAESLHTLYPRWKDALDEHADRRWAAAVDVAGPPEIAGQLRDGAAWPTLVARLESLHAGGVNAETALTDAITSRDLSDVRDPAAVVHWRLRQHVGAPVPADDEAPEQARPARVTFLDETPGHTGPADGDPLLRYARQLAEQMDQRIAVLADRTVNNPPPWAAHLGAVPNDPAARLEWSERAGTVAAYQEIVNGDADDPLGARPGPGQPDARARWDAANQALYGPPVAAETVSDEDLQAIVDRAADLTDQAPEIVVDDLREAHQRARDEQTRTGLIHLSSAAEGAVAPPPEDSAPARTEADGLEQRHQLRSDWVAEHGPEIAAGPGAAAELGRREAERATRPFIDLDDDQLHQEIVDAEVNVASIDRQLAERVRVVDHYKSEAAQLDDQATTTEWERPAWSKVKEDRLAETAAASRLGTIDDRLDRSALRGGPRGHERTQLQQEGDRLRSTYPAVAAGVDRAPIWEQRTETAWAQDKATADGLRANATALRDKADRVRATLDPLAEKRQTTQHRRDHLVNERRQRVGEPPRPKQSQPIGARQRPGPPLEDGPDGAPLPPHTPNVDPAPPLEPRPGGSPQR